MGRRDNITVFKDTEKLCKTNERLAGSVKRATALQKLIMESDVWPSLLWAGSNRFYRH